MFKRILIALLIACPFVFVTLPLSPLPSVSAHTGDCYSTFWTPANSGGKIYHKADMICSHASAYKLTTYICGGQGGGCKDGESTEASYVEYLVKTGTCTPVYAGPYYLYGGSRMQSLTWYGTWGNTVWSYGPGAWIAGSC
jgi:hypothetical protein